MAKTSMKYNLLCATGAFLGWGRWAYYVNGSEDSKIGLVSAFTQGTASFILTFAVVYIVTKLYNILPDNSMRLILPAVITVACIGGCMALIHSLAGTPHILATISPAAGVAFLFCIYTAYKLKRSFNS